MQDLIWFDYLTITIAALAFLQPWIIKLFDYIKTRFFVKPELECYCSNMAELYFNNMGPGLFLPLSLISKKCDSVIVSFQADVFEGEVGELKKLYTHEWTGLNAPYSSYMMGPNGLNINMTSLLLSPIYCTKDTPVSYGVQLTDLKIKEELNEILTNNLFSLEEKSNRTSTKMTYKESDYTISLTLSDIKNNKYVFDYAFSLTKLDIDVLLNNIKALANNQWNDVKMLQIDLQETD